MNPFNLITDPWLPVRWLDGHHSLISLDELFRNAGEIADLNAPPHERISLMRLLVCITQAALGAPAEMFEWESFGSDMEKTVPTYLARAEIHPHFNLFGDGPRFLQCKARAGEKSYPACQISFTLAAGNSPTCFDHYGESPRALSPAHLARLLLCYQNFFVGGSMASKVKGNGPSLKILHAILLRGNLKQTILANCVDAELKPDLGKPYWELGTPDKITGAAARVATESYLGRLIPLSCRLEVTGTSEDGFFIHIDQGLEYPAFPAAREASATVVIWKDEERILRADVGRGIWRDLHCVAVLRQEKKQTQLAPQVLQSHVIEREEGDIDLWLGELIKAKDAKIIDAVEDRFTVPHRLFTDGGRKTYQNGVQHAEAQSTALYSAVKTYGDTLSHEAAPIAMAQKHYWHSLDQQRQKLLELVKDDSPLDSKDFGQAADPWSQAVWKAACEAYSHACPATTPRQIEANALGSKRLRPKTAKPPTARKKTAPSP